MPLSLPQLWSSLPLAFWVWLVHMIAYHGIALGFEACDRKGALKRFKLRNVDRLSYGKLLRRVLFNQIVILLPAMLLCQVAGLAFVGPAHLSILMFLAGILLMGIGHDIVQYATHRWLLHDARLRWLGHSVHHATGASKAISAMYMSSADFFLNIVCPYLIPLVLIGGGGSDILFHMLTMGLGVIGGLYEHSGYDFGAARRGLLRFVPASLISSHAHAQHHRRSSVSFSDGFGSRAFATRCSVPVGIAASVVEKYGIAIVANDKVLKWLYAFLESWHLTNRATPLYIIPYDENDAQTRHAANVYGATMVDAELDEIDALAKRLYPLTPGRRRRLRKLQSLALPLDQVIYLDADIVLFRDFSPLFGKLAKGSSEFIIASTSPDYVYNDAGQAHELFQNATLFNDGFFSTSSRLLNVGDFIRTIDENEKLFHAVRKRGGLFAQPLVNFVVHSKGLAVRSLSETLPNASDESFYKPLSAHFAEDGLPVDDKGREIYFCHWAGAVGMPRGGIFDPAWQAYYDGAVRRMKQ